MAGMSSEEPTQMGRAPEPEPDWGPCTCPHAWRKSLGVLYGIRMMGGWVRTLTVRTCPVHGEAHWRAGCPPL